MSTEEKVGSLGISGEGDRRALIADFFELGRVFPVTNIPITDLDDSLTRGYTT